MTGWLRDRRRHASQSTEPTIALLKSPRYGPARTTDLLPYRIDLLASSGFSLRWSDEQRSSRLDSLVRRLEGLTVPFSQAWRTRRLRRDAVATIAMFESEAHGLALWRRISRRWHPPLIVIACWLTEVATQSPLRQRLYRQLYKAVDHVVVFSENQRDVLEARLGIPCDRITSVRFGVDLDELAEIDVSDSSGTIVAVGRDLGRDWRTLADAVRGTGWKVELVTRAMQVENIDLPAEIRHRHSLPRDQYLQLLADATIVVVPTHVRAYPSGQTVLLEAMALGKPCVVTDTPAMREYATDEVTALVVPPHDPPAVKRTIQRLLDEPLLRARLGSQAKSTEAEYGGAGVMWVEIARCVTSADASECAVNPPLPDTDQARPANTDR